MVQKVKLVQPKDATGEVARIFEDIRKTKGDKFLTPTWGFFAQDVELLRHWWGLTKRLQMTEGSIEKTLLNSISLVCAAEVDCPRCINNHQTHLIEHFGMSTDDVMEVLDFENSTKVDERAKAVLRFARKTAFNEPMDASDFAALRSHGITDVGVAEIVSMAMLESGMARHAVGVAQFENGDDWPRDNLPSKTYAENVNA
ncbi:MAG: carboxymuconolactone decarboxylase family protein [bacterium]|jgi:alkylhydroperoxidase family enzyme